MKQMKLIKDEKAIKICMYCNGTNNVRTIVEYDSKDKEKHLINYCENCEMHKERFVFEYLINQKSFFKAFNESKLKGLSINEVYQMHQLIGGKIVYG